MYVAQEHATNDVDPGRSGRASSPTASAVVPDERRAASIVHQGSLSTLETALADATTAITTQIDELLEQVESLTPGWDESSESHMAQLAAPAAAPRRRPAADRGPRPGARSKVATYREDAREIEVENVAIVN